MESIWPDITHVSEARAYSSLEWFSGLFRLACWSTSSCRQRGKIRLSPLILGGIRDKSEEHTQWLQMRGGIRLLRVSWKEFWPLCSRINSPAVAPSANLPHNTQISCSADTLQYLAWQIRRLNIDQYDSSANPLQEHHSLVYFTRAARNFYVLGRRKALPKGLHKASCGDILLLVLQLWKPSKSIQSR